MANEAKILTLYGQPKGEPINFTIADGEAVEKGQIMKMSGAYTVAPAEGDNDIIAGIASSEKVANDGSTTIGVWTRGIFDVLVQGAVAIGDDITLSGTAAAGTAANILKKYTTVDNEKGYVLGKALEEVSATNEDTIAVKLTL